MIGELLSWTLSSFSNIVWLFVFTPQLYENNKNKSSDAISFYLLLLWYIGDTFSTLSVSYKQVSPILLYVGVYHIIFDIIFILQVIYYRLPYLDQYVALLETNTLSKYEIFYYIKDVLNMNESLLFLSYNLTLLLIQPFLGMIPSNIIGNFLAWSSTFVFFISRIPQIALNYKRKSVTGLSFITFINIIIANQLFLASILTPLIDIDNQDRLNYIIQNFPWIAGSTGGIILDLIIFIQFIKYNQI